MCSLFYWQFQITMIISFNLKFYKVSFLIRFSYISKLSPSLPPSFALSDSQFWPICVLMASKFNNCFPDQTKLNFISFVRRFVSSSLYTSGQSKYFVSIFQTKLLSVASTDRPTDQTTEWTNGCSVLILIFVGFYACKMKLLL